MYYSIAIDGPAAAGKTTQAKALARELSFIYVDTGAMYRAFAVHKLWLEKELGYKIDVERALNTFDFDIEQKEDGQHMVLWGKDITSQLRTPEVSMVASETSAHPAVRETLLKMQQIMPTMNHVVMEGRDIGSVVIPNATMKVFLTASPEVRAKRRFDELTRNGAAVSFDEVDRDMRTRDYNDSHREAAPLRKMPDAILVDDSDLSIEDTTKKLLALWEDTLNRFKEC